MLTYQNYVQSGLVTIQQWHDEETGLWKTTGWWNSANVLWMILDYADRSKDVNYNQLISLVFDKHQNDKFLNQFYDDEGWWALTWVKAYDLTADRRYLDMAEAIFKDMEGAWDEGSCGGGCWWSKERKYKNAIANELFFALAGKLALRTHLLNRDRYADWAEKVWNWFWHSGMINSQNLINDGLDASCHNNGGPTWTYNQGVILGGLVDLYKIKNDASLLQRAEEIADATLALLVDPQGILQEPCESGDCGEDGPQFKGIFIRNLVYLYEADHKESYKQFILKNTDSVVERAHNGDSQFGVHWAGPVDKVNAASHCSAMDLLVATLAL